MDRQSTQLPIHNTLKIFNDDLSRLVIYRHPLQSIPDGFEPETSGNASTIPPHDGQNTDNLERSIRRTHTTISDIILSNPFDMFITFTIKADRYNDSASYAKIRNYLKRLRKQHPEVKYLYVPERHKDGALHFHAVAQNIPKKLLTQTKSKKYKNLKNYRSGFTTVSHLKTPQQTINYIKKYITKDLIDKKHAHRFYTSHNVKRPQVFHNITLPDTKNIQFHNNSYCSITYLFGIIDSSLLNIEGTNNDIKSINRRFSRQLRLRVTNPSIKTDRQQLPLSHHAVS